MQTVLSLIVFFSFLVSIVSIIGLIIVGIVKHKLSKVFLIALAGSLVLMVVSALFIDTDEEEKTAKEETVEEQNDPYDQNNSEDSKNDSNDQTEEDTQEEYEEISRELNGCVRKRPFDAIKIAKNHGFEYIIENHNGDDITDKYKSLSADKRKKYRITNILDIDDTLKTCSIVIAPLSNLVKRDTKAFKSMKGKTITEVMGVANDRGYKSIIKNYKNNRIDKKSTFDSEKYVETGFIKLDYDKGFVAVKADTPAHIKKLKEKAERERKRKIREAKKRKAAKERAAKKAAEKRKKEKLRQEYLSETVYISRTGNCYHDGGCYTLRGGGSAVTRADAKARGLKECDKCNPDSYWRREGIMY